MTDIKPDDWIVVVVKDTDPVHHRLVCGWRGNYKDKETGKFVKETWAVSGGIQKCTSDLDNFYFHTENEKVYCCERSSYGIRDSNYHVFHAMQAQHDVAMISGQTKFEVYDY